MNFLIFAGNHGGATLVATVITAFFGLAMVAAIWKPQTRAGRPVLIPLLLAGGVNVMLLIIFTIAAAISAGHAVSEGGAQWHDASHVTVEDLVALPGTESTAIAMQNGGFNVAVERDGSLVSISLRDLEFVDAGERPTLTTTTECELSDKRVFVWDTLYECTDTVVAAVNR